MDAPEQGDLIQENVIASREAAQRSRTTVGWIASSAFASSQRRPLFHFPVCRSCRCRLSPNGFTLLEVLVAFTILALMLTVLLRIFSDGFRGMTAADVHAAAALHAQAALASVGAEIPLAVGDWSGEHDDGFRWRVSIDLYDEPTMVAPLRSFLVYRILVSAEHGSGSGTVTLSSLRIGGAEPNVTGEEGDGSPLQ
ncbi:MAG: PulJ/GspJ family protein [Rhodospirillales bacterium]